MATLRQAGASVDRANVIVFPPVIGLLLILTGVGLHLAFPARVLPEWWLGLAIGLPVFALGAFGQAATIRTLRQAGATPIFRATSLVVRHGLYGRSRNPMYLSILIWFLGLAFAVNTIWLLALLPVLFLYLQLWVIAQEEAYLGRKFGEEYRRYTSVVRRWI